MLIPWISVQKKAQITKLTYNNVTKAKYHRILKEQHTSRIVHINHKPTLALSKGYIIKKDKLFRQNHTKFWPNYIYNYSVFCCHTFCTARKFDNLTFEKSKEFLSIVSKKMSERDFEPDDFVQIFKDLTAIVLDEFTSQYPCLHNGKIVALGQLNKNNLFNEVYVNLNGPELDMLLTNLESSVETFTTDDVIELLIDACFLGVPLNNPASSKIIEKIIDKKTNLSLRNIKHICQIIDIFTNRDLFVAQFVFPKFHILFNSELEKDEDIDINNLLSVLLKMRGLISADMITKLTHKLFPLFSEEQPLQQYKTISQCLRLYATYLGDFNYLNEKSQSYEFPTSLSLMWDIIINKSISSLPLLVDDISPPNYHLLLIPMQIIVNNRTSFRFTYDEFVPVLVKKILTELEDEQFSISKRILSMNALMFLGKKELIMNERYTHYLDEINFTDMIFFLHLPNCYNFMKVDLFLGKILDHVIDSFDVNFSLQYYMRYFHVYLQDNRLKSQVLFRLTEYFRDNCYTNESVCRVSGCIISYCYDNNVRPPKFMMKKLLSAVPHVTLRNIGDLLSQFEQVPKPWNRDFYKDFEIIHEAIVKNIATQLQDQQSISLAIQTIKVLYLDRSPGLRIDNLEMLKVLQTLPALVKHIKIFEFVKILKALNRVPFFDEQFLQSLESFAIQNHIYMQGGCLMLFLKYTFNVGYEINKELVTICINRLEMDFDSFSVHEQIYYVFQLCKHQIYPEKHIAKIFSLDYLKSLDTWMSDNMKKSNSLCQTVETILMMLNRTVVIDCPQLGIPWIMGTLRYTMRKVKHNTIEDKMVRTVMCSRKPVPVNRSGSPWADLPSNYSQRALQSVDRRMRKYVFKEQVDSILSEMLGVRYYKKKATLLYNYIAEFEFFFDEIGNSIMYETGKKSTKSSIKRFVVMLNNESDYCFNSRQLIGNLKMKTRHLQILGFKVIHIPYYEWCSMAYSTVESKKRYIEDKIISEF